MKKGLIILLMLATGFGKIYGQSKLSIKELKDSLVSIVIQQNIPGATIAVVSKDSVLFKTGIGLADIENEIPVNTQHLFKIGSVSKTFTALAIMKLIKEGELGLETKLSQIAPEIEFENKWEATHPLKIKHLLEHKTGFDDMHLSVIAGSYEKGYTAMDEVTKSKGSFKSRWKPGMAHSYSNPGYTLLGYLIEKVSGMRYQDYIKQHVLAPLHMGRTDFRSSMDEVLSNHTFAVGYSFEDNTYRMSRDARIIGESAGALLSNADEMVNFMQYFLSDTLRDSLQIAGKEGLLQMERLHGYLEEENGIDSGYGLALYSSEYGTDQIPFKGHNGGIHGFSSSFIYNKDLDIAIFVSSNGEQSNRKIVDALVDTFVRTKAKIELVNETIDLSKYGEWEGTYRTLGRRNSFVDFMQFPLETETMEIYKDSLVTTRFLQDPTTYYAVEGNSFREKDTPNASLFLIEDNGEHLFHSNNDIFVPVNSTLFFLFRVLFGGALIAGLLGIVGVVVLSIISIFKKNTRLPLKNLFIYTLPFLFFFGSIILLLTNMSLEAITALGTFSLPSILVFITTLFFPITALFAAYWLVKNWKEIRNKATRIAYSSTVFAALFLAVYCIYHGWFMQMLWGL